MTNFCKVTPKELREELLHFAANWPKLRMSVAEEYVIENFDLGDECVSDSEEEGETFDFDFTSELGEGKSNSREAEEVTENSASDMEAEEDDASDGEAKEDKDGTGPKESKEKCKGGGPKIRSRKNKSCKECASCCYFFLYRSALSTKTYISLFIAYKLLLTLSCTQIQCERCFSKLKYIKNRLRNTMTQDRLEFLMLMSVERTFLNRLSNDDIIDALALRTKLLTKLLIA